MGIMQSPDVGADSKEGNDGRSVLSKVAKEEVLFVFIAIRRQMECWLSSRKLLIRRLASLVV